MKRLITFTLGVILAIALASCAGAGPSPEKRAEYERLEKAWTPQVRDAFIDMGKAAGCFDLKVVRWTDPDGKPRSVGCWNSSSSYDKAAGKWITECEPLCRREAPECYADGWNPPKSERCKYSEEWHRKHDSVK